MPFNLAIIEKLLHKNDKFKPNENIPKSKRRHSKKKVKCNDNKEEKNLVKKIVKKPTKDMDASLFRFINEKLSLMTSKEAYDFFKNDPGAFETYHKGFGNQREKWPEDPVYWIISRIKSLNNSKKLIVADMGCGDGKLNKLLSEAVTKIHNFDLVSTSDDIISCDISNVPLEDKSVDVVVISLALMGINSNEYVAEANRILNPSGSLIIIELISRMKSPNFFISKIKKMGFEKMSTNIDKELVKENQYFLKVHFKKTYDCDRTKLPDLELKQVLYKKR